MPSMTSIRKTTFKRYQKRTPRNQNISNVEKVPQKHSFIPEEEIDALFCDKNDDNENSNNLMRRMDSNNNPEFYSSQESVHVSLKTPIDIVHVYMLQKEAFDALEGSKLVEDVLLKGKYWRDRLSVAERTRDFIFIYGLKVVLKNPSISDMAKKRFFACLHLHNAINNFGVRSALSVHIDIKNIQHPKVAALSKIMLQLLGDGYNFFALQFKLNQTTDFGKRLFSEPGAFGIYIGFAFILDYIAYRNACNKSWKNVQYDLKQYVEILGDEGYVIQGIEKSSGNVDFEYEATKEDEDLNMLYVEHLFNGVRFI